ncbi:MAG: hypothetical protein M8353_06010 [ANME-2 cluster archaeon]|nr:hypothetical protein [ANME-2 cluster archaeon]
MFLSVFAGSIAIYAVADFAKVTILKDYAVSLQAIMDVGLVSAAAYAFVSAAFYHYQEDV